MQFLWLLFFIMSIDVGLCHWNCDDASNNARKEWCEESSTMEREIHTFLEKKSGLIGLPPPIEGEFLFMEQRPTLPFEPCDCDTPECMGSYFKLAGILNKSTELKKSIRKEYRTLNEDERARFLNALDKFKKSGHYDNMATIHTYKIAPGAHLGPAFLPWHREYLKRFECGLKKIDPSVSLPYWDSSLDDPLTNFNVSILWSHYLLGDIDHEGFVVNGPFENWITNQGSKIRRKLFYNYVFSDEILKMYQRQKDFNRIFISEALKQSSEEHWMTIEAVHGDAHVSVGGDMARTSTAPNDPIFYMHHAFVDFIWESWKIEHQTREEREKDYPLDENDCAEPVHARGAPMLPWIQFDNIDGCRNFYTDNLYEYAPRPSCENNCSNSEFLFCDKSLALYARCVSKLKSGSDCSMYEHGERVCYNGWCSNGTCIENLTSGSQLRAQHMGDLRTAGQTEMSMHEFEFETCYNLNECCDYWQERNECQQTPDYMDYFCRASCKKCVPHNYVLVDECVDRHPKCQEWASRGECIKNFMVMNENCRKTCEQCGKTRKETCSEPRHHLPKPNPTIQHRDFLECYNNDVCCQEYALNRACSLNVKWMSEHCPLSCGYCLPNTYNYGSCTDYHDLCKEKASRGECRNPWMQENCRVSCNTCFSEEELSRKCSKNIL